MLKLDIIIIFFFSELKQEIQSKERKLNPDTNESQAAAAVRRCSSFRAAVDNRRLSSSTDTTSKNHTKSKLIKILLTNVALFYFTIFRFKWICCISFTTYQISQSWGYCWRSNEKSKCKLFNNDVRIICVIYHI